MSKRSGESKTHQSKATVVTPGTPSSSPILLGPAHIPPSKRQSFPLVLHACSTPSVHLPSRGSTSISRSDFLPDSSRGRAREKQFQPSILSWCRLGKRRALPKWATAWRSIIIFVPCPLSLPHEMLEVTISFSSLRS